MTTVVFFPLKRVPAFGQTNKPHHPPHPSQKTCFSEKVASEPGWKVRIYQMGTTWLYICCQYVKCTGFPCFSCCNRTTLTVETDTPNEEEEK
ncbi:hypothetical protein EXN66_Car016858 [Channa argus]|uniref:Uncharacterized protein n=1 Tax=Channa argus TaxID=215402 RepID=A0A6G1QER3_CHAAH|nr:hypothetical protein EXN66_Car016858 [Channa argus]